MIEYVALGIGFAFSAGIQPGPLQAFLFSRAAANGWKRTLPASLSPLLSDIPIALVVLLALDRLPPVALRTLRGAGGVLLIFLAWSTIRRLRGASAASAESVDSPPRTLLQAALVNVLNPNPYLGWALVLGPAAEAAWRQRPSWAVALVASFYLTMVVTLALSIFLFGTARLLGPRFQRALVGISALTLAAIGIYQVAVSLPRIGSA